MKKIMTEWRLYEQRLLWEQEFEEFFKEHYLMLDEGTLDWVLQKGRQVKDTIANTVSAMKDWAGEKIEAFVQFMLGKLRKFIQGLRNKGLLGKWESRRELAAINLLGTRKHIDLAVMLLSAIAKISGGFIIDKVAKLPETFLLMATPGQNGDTTPSHEYHIQNEKIGKDGQGRIKNEKTPNRMAEVFE